MIDVDGLYGDENEANQQRELAQAQGHKVGDVYKSGDEWGFNTIDGHNSKGTFDKDFSQNSSNRNGGMSSSASVGGAAIAAYKNYHVADAKYRGASGNYYSYKGRQGWNKHTGTKDHMNKTLSKAKWAGRATYGLGALNYGMTLNEFSKGNLSNTAFGIEMASTTIGTFAPSFISIPWTIGYEGLGRNGVARIPWYQNTFKPWARKKMGVE